MINNEELNYLYSFENKKDIEKIYVKNIYEEIADQFKVTRVFTWSWITDFINKLNDNSIIYDIGCGSGRNLIFDKHLMIGIDNCQKFIDICLKDNKLALYSDMVNINLPSKSADAIICIASFHHLSNEKNRLNALFEMKRLLKNNGKILLSVWSINQPKKTRVTFSFYGDNFVTWNKKYNRYYYIFKINELKQLFIKSGLSILDHKYDCGNEIFILTNISN